LGLAGLFFAEAVLPARVMVFLDYENIHRTARKNFGPAESSTATSHVDPLKVGKLLVSRRDSESVLVGVRIYRGKPNPRLQPASAKASDRQAKAWAAMDGVSVVRRPLRYPKAWPRESAQEKGIDVALAVDFFDLAVVMAYDVGILFSSDTDLLPVLEKVTARKFARVEVAAWTNVFRLRFSGTTLPWCHHLTMADFLSVVDPSDYTKPVPRA
jgi:uncharacterized LabA/DUF88 family protein